MKRNMKSFVLAYLSNVDIDYIVDMHIAYHCDFEGKPKPQRAILKQKYQYMLHLIITKCKFDKDSICHLNAEFYRDHIFYDHFGDMVSTLSRLAIVSLGNYVPNEHSTEICLVDWNIGYRTATNKNFLKWMEAEKKRKPNKPKYERTKFTDYYNECLKCLQLKNKDGVLKYIDEKLTNKSEHRYHYHISCIEDFDIKNSGIYSIDEQGRIYHFLTSLPRELRQFYNIRFELDIANSHPLLLNNYLINYYNIDYRLLLIMYSNTIYHYDGENLSKLLKDNNIEFNNIPLDVLEYIAKTQHGKFYDDFISDFGNIERSEVKKKVFGQVFYSHLNDPFVSKFCKAFKQKYPNVWKIIHGMKIVTDDRLPHLMMSLESSLFKPIIIQCWRKGWKVVNLHDALIVFDVKENEAVEVKELRAIIEAEYKKHGLLPTVKLEIGSE